MLAFSYGCGSVSYFLEIGHINTKRLGALQTSVNVMEKCLDIVEEDGRLYIESYLELFRKILVLRSEIEIPDYMACFD